MTESEVTFNKVYNEDKTRLFRIKTEWEEDFFRLFIVEGTASWFALVTKEHIDMLAGQHEIDPKTYLKNIQEYICKNQSSVSFDVTKKQFFIFRSLEKKFRIKYFYVNLEKLVYQETMETFVDELLLKYTDTLRKLGVLGEQKLEADSQKLLFEKKCEQFTELKRKSDLQMYSAFLLTLNEKKHRIRFLTELLEEYKEGRKQKVSETATSSKNRKSSKPEPKKRAAAPVVPREVLSDSDSNPSDGYNTDDERNVKVLKQPEAVPGTSKDNFDFLGGDSPPPSLPKRLKKESTTKCFVTTSVELDEKVQANGARQETTDMDKDDSDDSLKFDTQELLDRM